MEEEEPRIHIFSSQCLKHKHQFINYILNANQMQSSPFV